MKAFLFSDEGKAFFGLFLTAILIIWPAAAGWLAASITLAFSVAMFRRAFARLEEKERSTEEAADDTQIEAANRLAAPDHRRFPAPR